MRRSRCWELTSFCGDAALGTVVRFFIERSAPKGFACMIVRGIRFLMSFAIIPQLSFQEWLQALSATGSVGIMALAMYSTRRRRCMVAIERCHTGDGSCANRVGEGLTTCATRGLHTDSLFRNFGYQKSFEFQFETLFLVPTPGHNWGVSIMGVFSERFSENFH